MMVRPVRGPLFGAAALFAMLLSAAVAYAAPASPVSQPSSTAPRAGLLPPVIVLFEERDGRFVPNDARSSAAADSVSTAFVAEIEERQVSLLRIGREEIGAADASSLSGLPDRLAGERAGPLPEALLIVPYPSDRMKAVMERHGLDGCWIVSGVQVLPREGPSQGKRFVLRAALVGREGTVLYSDMVSDDASGDLRDPETARSVVRKLLVEYRTERKKAEAAQAEALAAEKKAAEPQHPHPAEFRVGLGVFVFADDGADLTVSFTPRDSRWQVGYRFVRWTDTFEDPYTGRGLTKTTETREGPLVNFLFHPEAKGTWYLGAALLKWSRTEVSLMSGASDSASVRALFYGGGYTGHLGPYVFYNLGMYLSPGTELKTNTGLSSEESSGGFDIQIQLGIAF